MKVSRLGRIQGVLACTMFYWAALSVVLANERPVRSPASPQESLLHLVVAPGLKVELAAHEPNVIDPVAIRFDEDGRMWVVEMRDYPTGSTDGRGGSRISVLEDRNGDGFFEKATVFADNLHFATGLQPWKGGVFVTMAGEVQYMKDTDGDGAADFRETWYKGFAEQNTQLRANHPRLGLDNHIYIANGLRGGRVVDARRPDAKPVPISGMDFRFDPITAECEAVTGVGQYGLTFDDYGNRFVCSNRNPAIHVVLEDRHLKTNPLVAVSAVAHDVAKAGDESRVFPITRSWTTSHLHAGQFTAACGLEVYRGNALPGEFHGNLFVCEPTGHLVHREIIAPSGVTFASQPAQDGSEFLASRDEWFAPVNLEVGPEGALYVVDMYRAVIEHPEWMPAELRERPDLLYGNDRGRIYRIVAEDFRRPAQPKMSSAPSEQLVKHLSHLNAWWRETASRLLLERRDKSIGAELRRAVHQHKSPIARIHALRLLEGLGLLSDDVLARAVKDFNPRVIEQALIVAQSHAHHSRTLGDSIDALRFHEEPRVRFQALLASSAVPEAPRHPADRWELDAMLIAAGSRGGEVLSEVLRQRDQLEEYVENPKQFVADLALLAAASHDKRQQSVAIAALLATPRFARTGLASLLGECVRRHGTMETVQSGLNEAARRALSDLFKVARREALEVTLSDAKRCEAVDFLAVVPDAAKILSSLARDESSQSVRLRAIAGLAKQPAVASWAILLERFSNESPTLQAALLDGVFASADGINLLLDEIANARIRATELDTIRTTFLLNHPDVEIKRRAETLFAHAIPPDRAQVLADYQSVLSMEADPRRGRDLFGKQCAACHRIDSVGVSFAPDISDSREKTLEQLLTDIIQPNRAIDSNYFSYTAVTVDGAVHTGILSSETSNSVTLKQAEGKAVTLRRSEIGEMYSNGVSLMPDGMEKLIPPQDMADLISFIKNWRYLNADGNRASE